jgi:crotonobetainyl-CoA:carnitine CoA-transferase CaiB-like acyl-CoA transferase
MPAADGGHLGAAYFHAANRGKRSIEIDFESEKDRDIVRKLAARSDILVENFKVGGLVKFGLDYKSLSALNPRLIYCSVTGFGQDGPYAPRAGYDLLVQGMGGIMSVTGMPDGEPMRIGIPVADIFTGVYSAVGILAALAEREKTGKGTLVDTALLDTQSGVLANQALSYFATGQAPGRIGNAHPVVVPYQVFPAQDGFVIIACGNDTQFVKLCNALGAPEVGSDPNHKTNSDRVVNRETLIPKLCAVTSALTRADILAKLDAVNVPAGPINNLDDVFADPQVIHRKMQLALPSDAALNGTIPGVRTPVKIGGEAMAHPRPSPRLGEHTDEILREIGEA